MKKIISLLMVFLVIFLVSCGEKYKIDEVVGKYEYEFEEELEGEKYIFKDTLIFNRDKTCEMSFQDTIKAKWDLDGNIYVPIDDKGNTFTEKFSIDGDFLTYEREDGLIIKFKKVK